MQKWSHPCELLIRAKMVPDRAGADTQVNVHVPLGRLRAMPGGSAIEQAWINAGLGEPRLPDRQGRRNGPDGRVLHSHSPPTPRAG